MNQAGLFGPLYFLGYLTGQSAAAAPAGRGFKGAGRKSMIAYMLSQEAHRFLAEQETLAIRQEATRMLLARESFAKAMRDANAAKIKAISTILLAEV